MNTLLLRLASLAVVLALWQGASGRLFSPLFISSPYDVAISLWMAVADLSMFRHAGYTAMEAGLGFVLGGTTGAAAGFVVGRSPLIDRAFSPFITAFYSMPKIALAPLFILWFGIGLEMKVMFISVIVFFLVFFNTYTGVRNVSRELLTVFRLMGAKEGQLMMKVVVPSTLTWVFAGLRLSVPYSLIGAIVAEMLASNRGLGYLVQSSASQFDTAGVFAALTAIILLALLLNVAVKHLERKLMPWNRPDSRQEFAI